MNRTEHVEWSKARANEILDRGDITGAFTSMTSDLGKHPETDGHIGLTLGMMQLVHGHLQTVEGMRDFIDGFN